MTPATFRYIAGSDIIDATTLPVVSGRGRRTDNEPLIRLRMRVVP
jgi:hypothetical protein